MKSLRDDVPQGGVKLTSNFTVYYTTSLSHSENFTIDVLLCRVWGDFYARVREGAR